MIEKITIKGAATYDEVGSQLVDLKKINFIYGANGSGKTTLSNFVADSTDVRYSYCYIQWKHDKPLKTLVYNKEFRNRNFGSGNINGVFTLGQATDEDIKNINKKQEELNHIKEIGTNKKETLDKQKEKLDTQKESFKEECWKKVYKKYENNFKEAFKGNMQKTSFKDKLLLEFDSNSSDLFTFDELELKAKTIFGEVPQNIPLIYNISFDEINTIEENTIWNNKIIGKSDVNIARMIQSLNLNDWVNQGKFYIQDNGICPFCQQETITDSFREQLEDYFDKSFIESIDRVKTLKEQYFSLNQNLINELTQLETNHKNNLVTKLDIDKFSAYFKTLNSQFISNRELLSNKIKEPSRSIQLISTKEQLDNMYKLIYEANQEIKKHNEIVKNYQTERQKLINNIWRYISQEYRNEIEAYEKTINGFNKSIKAGSEQIKEKREEYKNLNNEIIELGKDVTSVQPTVDEINRILKYYGFLNFEILPSLTDKNQYQIKREDGSLAESTLSEGEITFITFLYFLHLTKGATNEEDITQDKILVIDDPISSLDSNILFVVSTLIKAIMEDIKNDIGNIKQLIILTHNVYFHKEVSFIDARNNGDKNTFYWILRKKDKISTFKNYDMDNPIKTSYELLWQELKDKEQNSNITIQNTMRRIIENYFKILGNYKDNTLIQKFETQEEQIICKSLISWINDGSHGISDDLFIEQQDDSVDKYLEVFKQIFILTDHQGHYNMMMGIEDVL